MVCRGATAAGYLKPPADAATSYAAMHQSASIATDGTASHQPRDERNRSASGKKTARTAWGNVPPRTPSTIPHSARPDTDEEPGHGRRSRAGRELSPGAPGPPPVVMPSGPSPPAGPPGLVLIASRVHRSNRGSDPSKDFGALQGPGHLRRSDSSGDHRHRQDRYEESEAHDRHRRVEQPLPGLSELDALLTSQPDAGAAEDIGGTRKSGKNGNTRTPVANTPKVRYASRQSSGPRERVSRTPRTRSARRSRSLR